MANSSTIFPLSSPAPELALQKAFRRASCSAKEFKEYSLAGPWVNSGCEVLLTAAGSAWAMDSAAGCSGYWSEGCVYLNFFFLVNLLARFANPCLGRPRILAP